MTILVPIVLFGWIPAVLAMFAFLPPRRAVIVAFLVGWLFLPEAAYELQGLPDYTKVSATTCGIFLATVLFDPGRVRRVRLSFIDLPIVVFCVVPLVSSLTNGLGPYDGVSGVFHRTVIWGFPYFIGRAYFTKLSSLRELAVGVFVGGLIYVPLCLWEIRMSPQLHATLYGFSPSPFHAVIRLGGYRPKVFLHSGLPLGLWMTTASLMGVWLWRSGALQRVAGIRVTWLVGVLLGTTVFCKSFGALILLMLGLGCLFVARQLRLTLIMVALVCIPPAYMLARTVGGWYPGTFVNAVALVDEQRAGSFSFRLHHEDSLAERALQRPVFGWGGWGRNRVVDESTGADISVTDGLWVIVLGQNGIIGLTGVTAVLLLPAALLFRRFPATTWRKPALAAPVALAIVPVLYAMDCLMNAMPNPILVLASGAIAGYLVATDARRRAPQWSANALEAATRRQDCTIR